MCPCPSHDDRNPSLAVRDGDNGRVLVCCHTGCDQRDVIDALKALGLWEARERTSAPFKPRQKPLAKPATDNRAKARWLWQKSQPIKGTVAERYLRRERGISCPLPATLRFLAGTDRYPPAMIAAFVTPHEYEPGKLSVNADHITG
jgi:hypothetical protein